MQWNRKLAHGAVILAAAGLLLAGCAAPENGGGASDDLAGGRGPARSTKLPGGRATGATRAASAKSVPGCGSRSMRSSTGSSVSAAREAQGWKTTVFICTAHTAAAASVRTSCGCRRPLL